jgi:hypothetical protein
MFWRGLFYVGVFDCHRPACHNHVIAQGVNIWRQKLMLASDFIQHIANYGGEEIFLDSFKERFVADCHLCCMLPPYAMWGRDKAVA